MLRAPEFHLVTFVCFVSMGAALSLLNNLDQVVAALSPAAGGAAPAAGRAAALVVAFSVCNTLGRIGAGYASELALHRHVRPCACYNLLPRRNLIRRRNLGGLAHHYSHSCACTAYVPACVAQRKRC